MCQRVCILKLKFTLRLKYVKLFTSGDYYASEKIKKKLYSKYIDYFPAYSDFFFFIQNNIFVKPAFLKQLARYNELFNMQF
jgi:hypothetical protein